MFGRLLARLLGLTAPTPELLDAVELAIREQAEEWGVTL